MAVIQQQEPTEKPISERSQKIIETLQAHGHQLEDVSAAVQEIKEMLKGHETLKTAIIRAVKQFLSHIDPNWKQGP